MNDETGGQLAARFEDVWRENRPFLIDLAFRMLGNIGDAEDMVQDAFTRMLRTELDQIDDVRGRLDVVADSIDPADRVTLDDNVRLALLVVLEKLTPAERAVFVLHDVFRYPFDAVASIVGRSPDSCRKLASRARRRVEGDAGPARFAVEPDEHRQLAERFIAACAGGDLEALTRLLDADVSGQVELGAGHVPAPVVSGRDRVGPNLLRFFGGATGVTLVSQPVNGWPGTLAFKDGRLYALLVLETRAGLIYDIHATRDPSTLAALGGLVEARR